MHAGLRRHCGHAIELRQRLAGLAGLAQLFALLEDRRGLALDHLAAPGGVGRRQRQHLGIAALGVGEARLVERHVRDHRPRHTALLGTIGWLNRCRRLAKDWENLNRKALAFLRLASIRLMLRKLCNPS